MSGTYKQATDDMFAVALAAIQSAQPLFGYVPQIIWQNNGPDLPPRPDRVWVRVGRTTANDSQATLSTDEGAPGQRKYETIGLVWVQAFLPRSDPKSATVSGDFAALVRNAYRRKSTPCGVWFRNSRIVEVAPENETVRFNVLAEFQYSEIY